MLPLLRRRLGPLLALGPLLLASGCGGAGNATPGGQAPLETRPPGFWFPARVSAVPGADLTGLGYAPGTRPAIGAEPPGVTLLDAARVAPGVNLYSSGHAPEATLMDPLGKVLHRWSVDYGSLDGAPPLAHPTQAAWRRVRLLPDGGLLALHEGLALLRLDRESKVQWHVGESAHHDFDVRDDGTIVLLVRRAIRDSELADGHVLVEDALLELGPDGAAGRRISLLRALSESPWAPEVEAVLARGVAPLAGDPDAALDVLHTNAVVLLDERHAAAHPAFEAGRALVCFRELDALAVVSLDDARVVWFERGAWDAPHDPEPTAEGPIWLFDNGRSRGWSRVVSFDPGEGRELWSWNATPRGSFWSEVCGGVQPLPNGGVLVTESTAGRAFELDPEGEIVWRFVSPHRVLGKSDEPLVACLFELERLPADQPLDWLIR